MDIVLDILILLRNITFNVTESYYIHTGSYYNIIGMYDDWLIGIQNGVYMIHNDYIADPFDYIIRFKRENICEIPIQWNEKLENVPVIENKTGYHSTKISDKLTKNQLIPDAF